MIIYVTDFETVLRNFCSSGDWKQTLNEIQDASFLHISYIIAMKMTGSQSFPQKTD